MKGRVCAGKRGGGPRQRLKTGSQRGERAGKDREDGVRIQKLARELARAFIGGQRRNVATCIHMKKEEMTAIETTPIVKVDFSVAHDKFLHTFNFKKTLPSMPPVPNVLQHTTRDRST